MVNHNQSAARRDRLKAHTEINDCLQSVPIKKYYDIAQRAFAARRPARAIRAASAPA
jgi:hypothetical protein